MFLPSARRADIGARYSIQNFALSVAVGSGVAFLRYGRTSSFSNGPKETSSNLLRCCARARDPDIRYKCKSDLGSMHLAIVGMLT